ncbi:hypothetical protein ACFX5U_07045 [Sphingobacterium sp. SG20118]|uniref:hypothetical protein n=1 Tax=Sphingobacterium sp. SG20118 TaxID=3367156 RepID=UPI0037DFBE9F
MSTINQTTSVSETSNWKALFKGGNGIKATALALGVMLHATNIYLATTVMPSIIQDIGGLAYYAWKHHSICGCLDNRFRRFSQ